MKLNNKWEELFFQFLTHDSLVFRPDLCMIVDENGNVIANFGWIIPNDETISYLTNALEQWNLSRDINYQRQFEIEIYANLAVLDGQKKRLKYLYNLKNRFQILFDRIPSYQKVIALLHERLSFEKENYKDDFALLANVGEVFRCLAVVSQVITDAIAVHTKTILDIQEIEKIGITEVSSDQVKPEKLKWLCKDSIAAFIITELIDKGYIQFPTTNGERSFSKTATVCLDHFEFNTKSLEYLKNVFNPARSTISDVKKGKLALPPLDDVE